MVVILVHHYLKLKIVLWILLLQIIQQAGLVSFMDDDHPLTTTISMSFKETQLLTKADIDEGY